MPNPLSVRINDGTTDRHVTKYVSGLGWTKAASGGHQGMKFRLNLPRQVFSDLGPADRAWVYDARTGRTVFGAAYLENPTPVDGASGQAYDISAVGGMALANDESQSLIYIDGDLSKWSKDSFAKDSTSFSVDSYDPDATVSKIQLEFPSGTLAATGDQASGANYSFADTPMNIGALRVRGLQSGKTDAGWAESINTEAGVIYQRTMSTTGIDFSLFAGEYLWPASTKALSVNLIRGGAPTNVADDQTVTNWIGLIVAGQRVTRYGIPITGFAAIGPAETVRAHQVVEDLLGRLLRFCDPITAQVDATTFPIDQLAYADGAKAAAILEDLSTFEPDFWWGIHESNDAGLHRFGFRQWDAEPRYVVSVADGWRQSGSDIDLCNRVLVSWTDAAGKSRVTAVTAAGLGLTGMGLPVDALGARVKDADPINLPDGHGSEANALQIGAAVLRDKINPPRAGTVTVGRRIVDMVTGNLVAPWELEPGWPVVVREPGYQMRCTQVDYDHDSRSAVLTLGTPVLTESQRIARLSAA